MKQNKICIKRFDKDIPLPERIGVGDWIDLRCARDTDLNAGEYAMIPLGIGMKLPDGYEAYVLPRSSTFKKYGILMTNSMGIIDNSYSGEDDQWQFPAYAMRDTFIAKGDRIAQFRIMYRQPEIDIVEVEHLDEASRGGFGSTGVK